MSKSQKDIIPQTMDDYIYAKALAERKCTNDDYASNQKLIEDLLTAGSSYIKEILMKSEHEEQLNEHDKEQTRELVDGIISLYEECQPEARKETGIAPFIESRYYAKGFISIEELIITMINSRELEGRSRKVTYFYSLLVDALILRMMNKSYEISRLDFFLNTLVKGHVKFRGYEEK